MITEEIRDLLRLKEFVFVATYSPDGVPNSAPKFLVKSEGNFIYLADFVIGQTWENLKLNPKASLSFMDIKELTGYQINGSVELLNSGKEYDKTIQELEKKEVSFTSKHIIEELREQATYNEYEVTFPKRVVIFKIKVEGVTKIGPKGNLAKEIT